MSSTFDSKRGRHAALMAAFAVAVSSSVGFADEQLNQLRRELEPQAAAPGGETELGDPLDREKLVAAVLALNPDLEAARAAALAALSEVLQADALEDPMLRYSIAPLSVTAADVRLGHQVQIEQRFPFPGKLRLSGKVALADALAAREDVDSVRLRLGLAASQLFDDWYVVHRAVDINAENVRLLGDLKKSAEAQFTVGKASQQDPLEAEVELSKLLHEGVVLAADLRAVQARLNGLLHRPPEANVPPPPKALSVDESAPPPSNVLQEQAVHARPELSAVAARIEGREAAVALARRNGLPDFGVMGSYNSMWREVPHQYMVGVTINLPIYRGKRRAEVDGARAELARAEAEKLSQISEIRVQVDEARERLIEAIHALELLRTRVLPATNDQVAAARAGFETGRNSFRAVIDAQNNQRAAQLRVEQALADVQRRRAELTRVIGAVPAISTQRGDK